ncbi:MAG: peptidoglycan recognition protein, partial [Thermoleophilia bacterium]|nr:peptidoglycan recognition protein [Thermoleophilia bacterium]
SWTGSAGSIELRAQGPDGRWSRWVELHADSHGPDPGTSDARGASRRTVSDPIWVGAADRIQVRSRSSAIARDVRVTAINATATATPAERAATTLRRGAAKVLGSEEAVGRPYVPGGIHTRAQWGARDPRVDPAYAADLRGVVIHHTDSTNSYACSQVPALLRGIQRYHMVTQGWNDIGYNFLVDRCGGVWEGRAGGMTEPVIGAHSAGFNTSTAGIALLGTHTAARPTSRARLALRRVVAWRLDMAHVRPNAKMVLTARTSDKYPAGSTVRVRAVSGHRDLYPTACPGAAEYRDLNALAGSAWRLGGAKVANVTTSYRLRHPDDPLDASVARVNARAVSPWRDEYLAFRFERISTGELLHVTGGRGFVRQASWIVPDDVSVPAWDVRVVVNGARFNGQRARAATVAILPVVDDPGLVITTPPAATISPNGDGIDDEVVLAYTLQLDYRLQAELVDAATGTTIAQLLAPAYVGPTGDTPRELRLAIPDTVAAGSYELRVSLPADDAIGRSTYRTPITITR